MFADISGIAGKVHSFISSVQYTPYPHHEGPDDPRRGSRCLQPPPSRPRKNPEAGEPRDLENLPSVHVPVVEVLVALGPRLCFS